MRRRSYIAILFTVLLTPYQSAFSGYTEAEYLFEANNSFQSALRGLDQIIYFDPETPLEQQFQHGDDRLFLSEYEKKKLDKHVDVNVETLSSRVAAIVNTNSLLDLGGKFILPKTTIQSKAKLCNGETMLKELSSVNCTTFLIGPDLMATAGHCMRSHSSCRRKSIVFNQTDLGEEIDPDDVYQCEEILDYLETESEWKKGDYAVFRVDRLVKERPLRLSQSRVKTGKNVFMVGHSEGMSLSISLEGTVQALKFKNILAYIQELYMSYQYFTSDLDSFVGNSGSPIFERETGAVVGILFDGGEDYLPEEQIDGRTCFHRNSVASTIDNAAELGLHLRQIKDLKKFISESYERHGLPEVDLTPYDAD